MVVTINLTCEHHSFDSMSQRVASARSACLTDVVACRGRSVTLVGARRDGGLTRNFSD